MYCGGKQLFSFASTPPVPPSFSNNWTPRPGLSFTVELRESGRGSGARGERRGELESGEERSSLPYQSAANTQKGFDNIPESFTFTF